MSNFEDQLRAALRRQDPPEGFGARVLARTQTDRDQPEADAGDSRRSPPLLPPPPPHRLWWTVGAIAAAVTVVSFSASTYQHSREERAGQQAVLALRIAAEKLNLARDKFVKQEPVKQENDFQ